MSIVHNTEACEQNKWNKKKKQGKRKAEKLSWREVVKVGTKETNKEIHKKTI